MNKLLDSKSVRKLKLILSSPGYYYKTLMHKTINCLFPFIRKRNINLFINNTLEIFKETIQIVNPIDTLEIIHKTIKENKKGAYVRFGDGDVYLLKGNDDIFQKSSQKLSLEMREAFKSKGDNIFKSLSIHSNLYGKEDGMYEGNHLVSNELANKLISNTFQYFVGHKIYSPVALHYCATYNPIIANSFLKTLKKKTILLIGNKKIPSNKVQLLFGNAKHIKTSNRNAYKDIDRVEIDAINILNNTQNYGVVVIAMGCSGRPLTKRLIDKNYNIFIFDFGSLLDGIIGFDSRTWLRKSNINYELLLKDL